nr:ChaN family lipoprotein [Bacteroidota bacterium]
MKKLNFLVALATLILLTSMKSDNPAYRLYNTLGKEVKYKKLVKAAAQADIVLFGESHNNPISHWLQLQLTKDLYAVRGASLVLAAEMFESDNQLLLDEYISGSIRQKNFEDEAKLWKNYTTDYKPLVEFAKDSNLYFIASNIPRRYASIVHKGGFEALNDLSTQAKALIAPLPITYDPELECYKGMLEMMGGMAHANENLPKAQAAKDATMAYFIY